VVIAPVGHDTIQTVQTVHHSFKQTIGHIEQIIGAILLYSGLFFAGVTLILIRRRSWYAKRLPTTFTSENRSAPIKIPSKGSSKQPTLTFERSKG
jgi:hypothetical protein